MAEQAVEQTIGSPVPDFSLPMVGGGRTSLRENLESSKGAVVVFWSGVCSHCRRYDDYLNAFAGQHPDLALLVIAARQNEDRRQLAATVRRRGLLFPLLHDADRRVAHRWLVRQTPRAFLVDHHARLAYRGAIDNFKYPRDPSYEPYLERAVSELLSGTPLHRSETPGFGCPIESLYYPVATAKG